MIVSDAILADILSVSKKNIIQRIEKNVLMPEYRKQDKYFFDLTKLGYIPVISEMLSSTYREETCIRPRRPYNCAELFAGAGGLALGLEQAGFNSILLNEWDKSACSTLRLNRPTWNVVEGDVAGINFKDFKGELDLLSGGFPCQAFSYAGKKMGMEDARGTLFFEYARALKEAQPRAFLAENVRGLLNHDSGKTFCTIKSIISEIGYTLLAYDVLKAIFYNVPQKRERLILVGVRNDILRLNPQFKMPQKSDRVYTLHDAFNPGSLYKTKVPKSPGQLYPEKKRAIMQHVPEGGYWRDLSVDLQKEYMQGSYLLGGGKTGMARRLSMDEPSLTLTCSPAQKQTERCHPHETRPLTVREYARIQTFPDDWAFSGTLTSQYKQIGNAVPCNLAQRIGNSLVAMLNNLE